MNIFLPRMADFILNFTQLRNDLAYIYGKYTSKAANKSQIFSGNCRGMALCRWGDLIQSDPISEPSSRTQACFQKARADTDIRPARARRRGLGAGVGAYRDH